MGNCYTKKQKKESKVKSKDDSNIVIERQKLVINGERKDDNNRIIGIEQQKQNESNNWNITYFYYKFDSKLDMYSIVNEQLSLKNKIINDKQDLYDHMAKIFDTKVDSIRIYLGKTWKGSEISKRKHAWRNLQIKTKKRIFVGKSFNINIKYYYNMDQYKTYSYTMFGPQKLAEIVNEMANNNVILSSLIIKIDNNHDNIVYGYLRKHFGNNNDINMYHLISKYYCNNNTDLNIFLPLYDNNIYTNTDLIIYKNYNEQYIEYDDINHDILIRVKFKDFDGEYSVKVKPKDKIADLMSAISTIMIDNNIVHSDHRRLMRLNFDGFNHDFRDYIFGYPKDTLKTIMDYGLHKEKTVFVSFKSMIGN